MTPSLSSRNPALLRSRSRILDDHPLLRTLVKLVASHSRFVHNLLSLSAALPIPLPLTWIIW